MSTYEIHRTVKVAVIPTPRELAEALWDMNSSEQAEFFNHLAEIADKLPLQLHAISKELRLTSKARYAMYLIGEYSEGAN